MPDLVVLVTAEGSTETGVNMSDQTVRICLPAGAHIETRDPLSGKWLPFLPKGLMRHRCTDFSLLD